MYLKDNYNIVRYEMELAKKEKYIFAAKVVRGAYMDTETKVTVMGFLPLFAEISFQRADRFFSPLPIQPTKRKYTKQALRVLLSFLCRKNR